MSQPQSRPDMHSRQAALKSSTIAAMLLLRGARSKRDGDIQAQPCATVARRDYELRREAARDTRLYPRGLSARGVDRFRARDPRGGREAWPVRLPDGRAREGKGREGGPAGRRAEPDLPRDALDPWPRASASRRPSPAASRLKCVRTDPAFRRDGRGRRQDAGRRALVAPETGRRRTLRPRLARAGSAPRQLFGPALRPTLEPPPSRLAQTVAGPRLAQSRCRPTAERLRKRPRGRDGEETRTGF
jgi:hypothetical protein